jgi:hypothetical protein
MNITIKILARNMKGNAFKADNNEWFNFEDGSKALPYYEKTAKGDTVTVEYDKVKGRNIVKTIAKVVESSAPSQPTSNATQKTATTKSSTGFACEICGAEMKDGKYKKCYKCNQSGAVKKEEPKPTTTGKVETPKSEQVKKTYNSYDNPEKTAQIQRGNAGNMAAAVMSNPSVELANNTPENITKVTLAMAEEFLQWLRSE